MLNSIDIIMLFIVAYAAVLGWQKGIIRLSINFFSLIISSVIAGLYFRQTNQIVQAFGLLFISFFLSTLILSQGLKTWNKKISRGKPPFLLSRLLGCSLMVLWTSSLIGLILLAIIILPSKNPVFARTQKAVMHSSVYEFMQTYIFKELLPTETNTLFALLQNNDQLESWLTSDRIESVQETEEFQILFKNDKIQEILKDEHAIENLKTQNITQLLSDPRIYNLLQDPQTLKQVKNLYQRIQKMNLFENTKPSL